MDRGGGGVLLFPLDFLSTGLAVHDTDALTSHPASNIVSVDWKVTVEESASFSAQHTTVFVETVRHWLRKRTIMIT